MTWNLGSVLPKRTRLTACIWLVPNHRKTELIKAEDRVLLVGAKASLRTALQLSARRAKDLFAMLLLGKRKIHPLNETVLENPGSSGNHLYSEEPKGGFEFPRIEDPCMRLIAEPLVVVVLDRR